MQKRPQLAIIIALLSALIIGVTVRAQDKIPVEIFYIIEPNANIDINAFNEVLTAVKDRLTKYNIDVTFVSVDFTQSSKQFIPIAIINLPNNGSNQIHIWAQFQNQSIERLSPILFSVYLLELDLRDENTVERLVALVLYQTDMTKEAEAAFLSYLPEPDEEFIDDYFYVANLKILQGDYDMALEYLKHTEGRTVFQSTQSAVNQAWILWRQGNTDNAFWLLDNAVNMEDLPGLKVILLSRRAQLYALAFDYDSAIADMDTAIELAEEHKLDNTSLAELYTIRGEIIFLIYEWDRVLDNFNHAIDLDPNYAPAYFQRGVLYYTMALRPNALADFEKYLELAPEGQYAEEAQKYVKSIPIELEALGR